MKHSIKNKFALLIFLTTAIISAFLIIVSTIVVRNLIDEMYMQTADNASNVAAANVNPQDVSFLRDKMMEIYEKSDKITSADWGSPEFEAYQALYEPLYETEEYKNILKDLKVVQDGSNVSCIYIFVTSFSNERKDYLYLVDADNEEPCPIGCIDSYEWADEQAETLTKDPEAGMKAFITNTEEYGWLVSNLIPIFDEDHNVLAYACTDVSMNDIRYTQNVFTFALIGIALVIMILIYLITTIILNRTIVKPVKELSETAKNYWADGKTGIRHDFEKLNIKSDDEIGILSDSMKKMETDINDYFQGLEATKQELGAVREESEAIREMAQKDGLTGVRNKSAYNTEIADVEEAFSRGKLKSYGIAMVDLNYLKVINDTYGHDKGDIAIKKICSIVCNIFDHSPVFRIGGDEFVALLISSDLQNIESLITSFKKIVSSYSDDESLEPWERVSAAIGYAIYEPGTDSCAKDVFKRADAKMYEDKIAQKANRK